MRRTIVGLGLIAAAANIAVAQDANRKVEGGGISAAGWMGKIDPSEAAKGDKLENAKLADDGPRSPRHDRSGRHVLESGEQGQR